MKLRPVFTLLTLISVFLLLGACISAPLLPDEQATSEKKSTEGEEKRQKPPMAKRSSRMTEEATALAARMYAAMDIPGGKVLKAALEMVDSGTIVAGGCWTFVNAVYEKAGFTVDKRIKIHHAPKSGPYADPGLIKPGDWIMYLNLPYNEIDHSAIFVEWIDFERRSALTIDYPGGNANVPGRWREADITKTFGILRGSPE